MNVDGCVSITGDILQYQLLRPSIRHSTYLRLLEKQNISCGGGWVGERRMDDGPFYLLLVSPSSLTVFARHFRDDDDTGSSLLAD